MLPIVIFKSLSMRAATAANSLPATVIWTERVLRSNSLTPSAASRCLTVRVTAGCDVFISAAVAMKLPYSASATIV